MSSTSTRIAKIIGKESPGIFKLTVSIPDEYTIDVYNKKVEYEPNILKLNNNAFGTYMEEGTIF